MLASLRGLSHFFICNCPLQGHYEDKETYKKVVEMIVFNDKGDYIKYQNQDMELNPGCEPHLTAIVLSALSTWVEKR